MVSARWDITTARREKAREDLLLVVHLHFSIRCEHVLHRRLRLGGVHVDDPFNAVHTQAVLETTETTRGKMNSNERSKFQVTIDITFGSPEGMPHRVDIIPNVHQIFTK